jgi:DNA-directed RNA polymerase specialized sigma24 family protein
MKLLDEDQNSDRAPACFRYEAQRQVAPLRSALPTVARLRAFARLLCLDVTQADELVALTLLRASPTIRPSRIGPELSVWLFSRLCSYYHSEFTERSKPVAQWSVFHAPNYGDAALALAQLSAREREALGLVDAAGFSIKEGASICHCTRAEFEQLLADARSHFAVATQKNSAGKCQAKS